ncbi:macrolide export ATP-binding/permease protein MacB [Desulfosporosinus acididurans]|uniref:Macrolide export ATP-binding/permease protein MacB n=1 Tax=Desulfosporosinus acididurans TaxID=476652 RepID=A0A0J1FS80_9FIRM|nr:ABC transporter ATP-binding protein [Desulfosporosinus acididurans]KLU65853.1 macrolide export ATP-binding/permease protein MacB [Desulfosporosinus acididurans]
MIILKDILKIYKTGDVELRALSGINLKIEDGEFVAIMGPSGSGKSTMMNILGCLDTVTSGEYLLDDLNINHAREDELAEIRNQKIGFVFQSFNLLSRTTALENVELPMLYNGIGARERRIRATNALTAVGLSSRLHHKPNELSGGQQQRVAIARSLVNNPVILMADEPTGNLDSKSSIEVMNIFQQLNTLGITIVLVTHEPDIAQYSKRIIHFKDGSIDRDEIVKNRSIAEGEPLNLNINWRSEVAS